jgi:hypothetical protein
VVRVSESTLGLAPITCGECGALFEVHPDSLAWHELSLAVMGCCATFLIALVVVLRFAERVLDEAGDTKGLRDVAVLLRALNSSTPMAPTPHRPGYWSIAPTRGCS